VEVLIIDEADRMLIWALFRTSPHCDKVPRQRQTLLFSATMPRSFTLADRWLFDLVDGWRAIEHG
jgi:superfamily II DNA/RNA helicase